MNNTKDLIKVTIFKRVTKYNEEFKDWSGEEFIIFDDVKYINTFDELETLLNYYGLDLKEFRKLDIDNDYLNYCVTENENAQEDENGKFLADYELYLDVYKKVEGGKKDFLKKFAVL